MKGEPGACAVLVPGAWQILASSSSGGMCSSMWRQGSCVLLSLSSTDGWRVMLDALWEFGLSK